MYRKKFTSSDTVLAAFNNLTFLDISKSIVYMTTGNRQDTGSTKNLNSALRLMDSNISAKYTPLMALRTKTVLLHGLTQTSCRFT